MYARRVARPNKISRLETLSFELWGVCLMWFRDVFVLLQSFVPRARAVLKVFHARLSVFCL